RSSYSGIRGGAAPASKIWDSDGSLPFEPGALICKSQFNQSTTRNPPSNSLRVSVPIPGKLQLIGLGLKQLDFSPQHQSDTVFGEIDRRHAGPHALSNFFYRQLLQNVQVEHLV